MINKKRTIPPAFPWMGSKRRLAEMILPLFPEHMCYVEPFCGSAAIFFKKQPAKAEVINDTDMDIINFFLVVKNHPSEFIKEFNRAYPLVSRALFESAKRNGSMPLTDIQKACRFFYIQKLCFGGQAASPTFGTATTAGLKLNYRKLDEIVEMVSARLQRTCIENLSWNQCIEKYDRPHTLFYLDPPYHKARYAEAFDPENYQEMADLMSGMRGKAILSINDSDYIRDIFCHFEIQPVKTTYTVGLRGRKGRQELIVKNF